MKILHITNAYPNTNEKIKGIFVKEQIDSIRLVSGNQVDVMIINAREEGWVSYVKSLFKCIRVRNNYDIIHCHHVLTGLIASIVFPRRKLILSYMNDGNNNLKGKLRYLSPLVMSYLNAFFIWKIFKVRVPKSAKHNSFQVQNGVDLNFFRPNDKREAKEYFGFSPDKVLLLHVSANSMRHEKRIDIFYRIISELESRGLRIEPFILNNLDRELIPLAFSASDFYILTSDFEGSPNALKEAMACGTIPIARDVGSVRQILGKEFEFLCLNSVDEKDYANVIQRICENNSINSFSAALREQIVEKELDSISVAKRINDIYSKIREYG